MRDNMKQGERGGDMQQANCGSDNASLMERGKSDPLSLSLSLSVCLDVSSSLSLMEPLTLAVKPAAVSSSPSICIWQPSDTQPLLQYETILYIWGVMVQQKNNFLPSYLLKNLNCEN